MSVRKKFVECYEKLANKFFELYKINIIISTTIIIAMLCFLFYQYYTTGDIIKRGVDFAGGYQYVVKYDDVDSVNEIIKTLEKEYPGISIRNVESEKLLYVEYPSEINAEIFKEMKAKVLSKRTVQSSMAETFWKNAVKLLIISYSIVTIVVFVIFRSFVPSMAIILAGISDILFAIVVMNLLNIPLTMGTLSSLLILMGYSIDTDILLTTRTLKERPTNIKDALVHSSKTGLTMTLTSMVAMISLILFSTSVTLDRIAMVILAGLFADIIFTWFQNASILRIYLNKINR